MEWKNAFLVARPSGTGEVTVVYEANSFKDARYWLSFIAEPGDALFSTPKHARYSGNGDPTYMSHLVQRGKTDQSEGSWKQMAFKSESATVVFVSTTDAAPRA